MHTVISHTDLNPFRFASLIVAYGYTVSCARQRCLTSTLRWKASSKRTFTRRYSDYQWSRRQETHLSLLVYKMILHSTTYHLSSSPSTTVPRNPLHCTSRLPWIYAVPFQMTHRGSDPLEQIYLYPPMASHRRNKHPCRKVSPTCSDTVSTG